MTATGYRGKSWIVMMHLLSLYPAIARWDGSHDLCIRLQRQVFRENSASIEETKSPIAFLPYAS